MERSFVSSCTDLVSDGSVQSSIRQMFVSYVCIEYPIDGCNRRWDDCFITCMDWVLNEWLQSPTRWLFVSYVRVEYLVTVCSRQWGEFLYCIYRLNTQWLGAFVNEVRVCIVSMDWVPSDWMKSPMRWLFVSYVWMEYPVTGCSRQWGESLYIVCLDWVPSDWVQSSIRLLLYHIYGWVPSD